MFPGSPVSHLAEPSTAGVVDTWLRGPHCRHWSHTSSLNRSLLFSVSQFPPWDQVRRARIAGNPVNPRRIWNMLEGLRGCEASRHHVTSRGSTGGRAGFSQGLGLAAFLPGGAWRVMLPAGGWDESGPEVFSSHGFSSQVRILAAEGRAWSRRLGNPQRPQPRPWIGRSWEESGLPISDLQPVPSCFTFSSFHVAAQSPVMGSAEVSGSPGHCLREEPK